MNTQLAFAFGMLTMVAITMLVVIVVGVVKVIKLEKHIKELDRTSSREIEFVHKHITDIERSVYSGINEVRNNIGKTIEDLHRELMAYTDSRFDKALSTKEKQLIKS